MPFPFYGEEFTFTQPDGTQFQVRGWGDRHHAVFETLDGYTVVQDPVTGYYQYATIKELTDELESHRRQTGDCQPRCPGASGASSRQPSYGEGPRRDQLKPAANGFSLGDPAQPVQDAVARGNACARDCARAAERKTVGDFIGLCLLIQFPDVPGTIRARKSSHSAISQDTMDLEIEDRSTTTSSIIHSPD